MSKPKYPRECHVFDHRSLGECQLIEPVNSLYGIFFASRYSRDHVPIGYKSVRPMNAAARDLLAAVECDDC